MGPCCRVTERRSVNMGLSQRMESVSIENRSLARTNDAHHAPVNNDALCVNAPYRPALCFICGNSDPAITHVSPALAFLHIVVLQTLHVHGVVAVMR